MKQVILQTESGEPLVTNEAGANEILRLRQSLEASESLRSATISTMRRNEAELTEARRLLDDARAQKPVAWRPKFDIEGDWSLGGPPIEFEYAYLRSAPVPAQPAIIQHDSDCSLHNAPALPVGPCDCSKAQPAAMKGSTHCVDCGCDWLDNGLNPVGCPYCKRNDDKFNPCLNDLVRQVALMMDDCEEHADGTITIDCDISQGFLRRIYDLLSALEDGGYDAIEPQPAAVPEAVAKDAARYRWLRESDAVGLSSIFSAKIDDATVGLESMYAGEKLDAAIDARLDAYSHSVRDKDAPTDTHVRCNGCGAHWKINTLSGCHECDMTLQDMKDAGVYEEIEVQESES